ncbi:CRISPR-associated endonuclease Cas2 [Rhodopseudomonas palustris]|uniref:CRISPR-associated endonuclease Cas2 n=1 Tax=Rhodopseudomonas palustris TaxID=1076 RepID=UPI002ACEA0C4|nr:CRISPR-associated endonuclease Cas2 [Rhodopseudomonas palustris]WQG98395.1 CRISPR-associated endonuclease Cas2 [Rhodopseudomonas palustris]
MSRDTMLRVICYDVSSDVRRRKIARILEDRASRVQFSVFETRMTGAALARLVRDVEAHLGKDDSLRVYSISTTSERHCDTRGGLPIEPQGAYWLM